MNINVYPLVWFISDASQRFLGLTDVGERKILSLPSQKSPYDRHKWGMFHWFSGQINETNEITIEGIIEKNAPILTVAELWVFSKKNGTFKGVIEEQNIKTYFEANSIQDLDKDFLKYVRDHKIDRLLTCQSCCHVDSELMAYIVRVYFKESIIKNYHKNAYENYIRNDCNVLNCTPGQIGNYESTYPTLYTLGLSFPILEEMNEFAKNNTKSVRAIKGEYRNIITYEISRIYIDEMIGSSHQNIQKIGKIMSKMNKYKYLFMYVISLPLDVIEKIHEKIDRYEFISRIGFEIEVTNNINEEWVKEVNRYDYIIQLTSYSRLIYHDGEIQTKGIPNMFPYLINLLEIITKNWHDGIKELPSIPTEFTINEISIPRRVLNYYSLTPNLREICDENNLSTNKKIDCIRIHYDFQMAIDYPVVLLNPNKHRIAHNFYQKKIQELYNILSSMLN
jgi:uncharacterized protein YlbG (UPF0298 family)